MTYSEILSNYMNLRQKLDELRFRSPGCNDNILLLAVTKQQPVDKINILLNAGHRFFAENRVNDAQKMWNELKNTYPDVELHLIGTLQTNKVSDAVALFDVIETVDRIKLVTAINKEAKSQGKIQRCMLQVNIGMEQQKSGVHSQDLSSLYTYCHSLANISIEGLMCIPPADCDPEPYFRQMQALQHQLELPYLSMGMSGDYETAVRCGATHIRIGTALMGERE